MERTLDEKTMCWGRGVGGETLDIKEDKSR